MTKIEVLAVFLVVGALGTLSGVAVLNARARTRDVVRLSHVREIQGALESFYADHAQYPLAQEMLPLGQAVTLCLSNEGFACSIPSEDAYLERTPTPPVGGQGASCGGIENVYCYVSDGERYRIQFALEGANAPLGLTKGLNCATEEQFLPGECGDLQE